MLLISCIIHNKQDTVALLSRETWKIDEYLMGNRKTVLACEYNPVIFHDDEGNSNNSKHKHNTDKISIYCALGGCDSTISIWKINKDKPILVIKNIVKSRITDISWAQNGYNLYISGSSGEVVVLSFTTKELGTPFTPREKELYITNHFGSIRTSSGDGNLLNGMTSSGNNSGGSGLNLLESLDILQLQEKAKKVFIIIIINNSK